MVTNRELSVYVDKPADDDFVLGEYSEVATMFLKE